ncbi:MAG: hypothetical protein WCN95_15130 [bacterium]
MKSQSAIILVLFGMRALADDVPLKARQIPFACDRTHVIAQPTKTMTDSRHFWRNTPGAGRCLRRWTIRQERAYVFRIEGTITDDNVGFPVAGADIYVGNLGVTNVLDHYGTSQTNGHFQISVSIATWDDVRQTMPTNNTWRTIPTNYWTATDPSNNYPTATHETLKRDRRYLYVGCDGVDLYQYEIPYEKVEPVAGATGGSSAQP